jgi:hypothetical protein
MVSDGSNTLMHCAYESGVKGDARELLGLTGLSRNGIGSVLDGRGHGVPGMFSMRGDSAGEGQFSQLKQVYQLRKDRRYKDKKTSSPDRLRKGASWAQQLARQFFGNCAGAARIN